MTNLFAYGTLMCRDIMHNVSGCRLTAEPGTLRGYSRRAVRGERYPALIPDEEGCVNGVVYRNLPHSAWPRLDRFEGEMYARRSVEIALNNGAMLTADTYVARQKFLDRLESSEWDFEDFLRNGKNDFQRRYGGYQRL